MIFVRLQVHAYGAAEVDNDRCRCPRNKSPLRVGSREVPLDLLEHPTVEADSQPGLLDSELARQYQVLHLAMRAPDLRELTPEPARRCRPMIPHSVGPISPSRRPSSAGSPGSC